MKDWFSPADLANLPGLPETTSAVIRKAKSEGWKWRKRSGRGGGREYHYSSLPAETQDHLHCDDDHSDISSVLSDIRDLVQRAEAQSSSGGPGKRGRKPKAPLPPLGDDEARALWELYDKSSEGMKQTAQTCVKAVALYYRLANQSLSEGERKARVAQAFYTSPVTVWRWVERVRGQDPQLWPALLLPNYKGRMAEAEFTPEAWEWIKAEWGTTSRPSLRSVYDRATRVAPNLGWKLPSYDTVRNRLDAQPQWWRTLVRFGPMALEHTYPALDRLYSTLDLHALWESDGHRADVFCRWPDGHVARPILVAWREVRTRYVLGWAVGRSESADLIRLAFRNAAEASNALPHEVLVDNGRGYASKLLTGGTPTRYRFKVKEEDVLGIFPMMGANVVWTTPEHGQSKPIESWWRFLADRVSKHSDFAGAYCGNRPDAKPEDFDSAKAVPIEQYIARLKSEIDYYNAEHDHRGEGMHKRSPREVYDELLPQTKVRVPAPAQLRLCLLAAEQILLDPEDHSIRLLGNRYWSEALMSLPNRGPYTVRFDPTDARVPVAVYDGGRFRCEAQLREPVGFRDQEAAKQHQRARRKYVKAKVAAEKARKDALAAKRWEDPVLTEEQTQPPSPKVAELIHLKFGKSSQEPAEAKTLDENEFDAAVERAFAGSGKNRL